MVSCLYKLTSARTNGFASFLLTYPDSEPPSSRPPPYLTISVISATFEPSSSLVPLTTTRFQSLSAGGGFALKTSVLGRYAHIEERFLSSELMCHIDLDKHIDRSSMADSPAGSESANESGDDSQLTIRIPNPKVYMARQSQWKGRRGKPRCDHCRLNNLKVCLPCSYSSPTLISVSVTVSCRRATTVHGPPDENANIPRFRLRLTVASRDATVAD